MNKTFKTKWSSSRQQYIVTDEKHVLKGKASKNTVTLAIAAVLAIASGTSSAAYVEKGVVAIRHRGKVLNIKRTGDWQR